jgi:hypothetical protein
MHSLVDSPLFATLVTLVGAGIVGISGILIRLYMKVTTIDSAVKGIAEDVAEIKEDKDIVRYSDQRNMPDRKKRRGR